MIPLPSDGDDLRRLAEAADRLSARRGELGSDVWIVEFRPLPDDVPAANRVRRLLKWVASLKLRCVLVRNPTASDLRTAERTQGHALGAAYEHDADDGRYDEERPDALQDANHDRLR
jgi:hypothetical protein